MVDWFEGVCLTTVILAPGACGLGLRAALLATISVAPDPPAAPAAVFQKSPISCYLSYLRARGLSKIDQNHSLASVLLISAKKTDVFRKGVSFLRIMRKKTHVSRKWTSFLRFLRKRLRFPKGRMCFRRNLLISVNSAKRRTSPKGIIWSFS